ncbi:MAG TPA: hypothetical protein DEP72_04000 [Clostridiales bacterium]|nr:MAG: hypothetical protein A2Y18_04275 [Clostridiales bacterium GWD2_32_19]HCC07309.1 hypothetical protein [Clostridiales bacterium]
MPTLYMLCGKVGSGKSTYARKMEAEQGVIHFSADDYMLHFYGHLDGREAHEAALIKCEEMIYRTCEKLLGLEHSVVLDFGFWKRAKRDYIRERFAKYDVRLIYLNYSDEVIRERVHHRNKNLKENEYEIPDHEYELFSSWFEEPGEDEKAEVVK